MKNNLLCKVPKCLREVYAKRLRLCRAHHERYLRGDLQPDKPIRKRRTYEEMQRRVIQKAPKKGSIPLADIKKMVKSVEKSK